MRSASAIHCLIRATVRNQPTPVHAAQLVIHNSERSGSLLLRATVISLSLLFHFICFRSGGLSCNELRLSVVGMLLDVIDDGADRAAIRTYRLRNGWTIQELADAAELTYQTVWRAETGRGATRLPTLRKLASAMGVPVTALIVDGDRIDDSCRRSGSSDAAAGAASQLSPGQVS